MGGGRGARAMADLAWTALRVLHIGSAITLVGGATMWAMLQPTLQQMGPTLPRGFLGTVGGKVVRILPNAGLATLLTGALLFYLMMPVYGETWRMLMGASLVLMLVSLGISFGGTVPTFRKLGMAMATAQGPPGPAVQALAARMKLYSMAGLVLGWLIVLLMVLATALRST